HDALPILDHGDARFRAAPSHFSRRLGRLREVALAVVGSEGIGPARPVHARFLAAALRAGALRPAAAFLAGGLCVVACFAAGRSIERLSAAIRSTTLPPRSRGSSSSASIRSPVLRFLSISSLSAST